MKKVYEIVCYVAAEVIFLLTFVGGIVVETFLGYQIYGEIYLTRFDKYLANPVYLGVLAISLVAIMIELTILVEPTIKELVKELNT